MPVQQPFLKLPIVTLDVNYNRETTENKAVYFSGADQLRSLLSVLDTLNPDAIARLQDNPVLAKQLGKASREKALTQFDEQIVIQRTMEVYKELLV